MKNNISAIIVVKDSPSHLQETIFSIDDFADEIIISDIGMKKELSAALFKNKKIKILKIEKEVPYVELIREELKNKASGEFILILDPDEVVPSGLKKIIIKNFKNYDYFKIPRKNIIFGKWIIHSRWWPDYQIRFFRKNKVIWPKTIHQQPKALGKEFVIAPKEELSIIHYNYNNIDDYLSKAIRYAKVEAQTYIADNKELTFGETIKKAANEFISRFFTFEGYKDGLHGLVLAFLQMFYYFLVYFYWWEMKQYRLTIDEKGLEYQSLEFFRRGYKEALFWKKDKTWKEKILKKII